MKKQRRKTERKLVGKFVSAKIFFLFCFTAYSFIGLADAQTNKPSREQRKKELIAELEEKITSFFITIKDKQELVMSQKNELKIALEKYQTKKQTRKTRETDEMIKQLIEHKIASLEYQDKEYQRMENEAVVIQYIFDTQVLAEKNVKSTSVSQTVDKKNAIKGYYVVLGSFKEKNDAIKFFSKLQKQYSNAVDMENDNENGMFRIGIGPYTTKEEAATQKPVNKNSWILKL